MYYAGSPRFLRKLHIIITSPEGPCGPEGTGCIWGQCMAWQGGLGMQRKGSPKCQRAPIALSHWCQLGCPLWVGLRCKQTGPPHHATAGAGFGDHHKGGPSLAMAPRQRAVWPNCNHTTNTVATHATVQQQSALYGAWAGVAAWPSPNSSLKKLANMRACLCAKSDLGMWLFSWSKC